MQILNHFKMFFPYCVILAAPQMRKNCLLKRVFRHLPTLEMSIVLQPILTRDHQPHVANICLGSLKNYWPNLCYLQKKINSESRSQLESDQWCLYKTQNHL